MSITIKLPSNSTCPQQVLLPDASVNNDGIMTALQAAKLAALWAASGKALPVVTQDTPAEIVYVPLTTGGLQGTLLLDATLNADGCITAAMVQQLESLFAASGLPTPVVKYAPVFIKYDPNTINTQVIAVIPPATARNGGVMSAEQFLQLQALGVGLSGVNGSLVSDSPHVHPAVPFPFGYIQLTGVVGFTGSETGTVTVSNAAQPQADQTYALIAVYSPTALGLKGNTQAPPIVKPDANNPNIHWVFTPGP